MKLNGRKMATGALAAVSAVALCGALAGCGSNDAATGTSSSGSAAAESDNHVVLGYWGGTCEAPIYIGYEKGFFQEEGLDPEMLLITSDVAPLMANDELDWSRGLRSRSPTPCTSAASRALPGPTPASPAWRTWRARRWPLTWAPWPRSR